MRVTSVWGRVLLDAGVFLGRRVGDVVRRVLSSKRDKEEVKNQQKTAPQLPFHLVFPPPLSSPSCPTRRSFDEEQHNSYKYSQFARATKSVPSFVSLTYHSEEIPFYRATYAQVRTNQRQQNVDIYSNNFRIPLLHG